MACINCGAEVTGNYCSSCGQRSTVKRLSFREGWNDFWARIYGFDGKLPRTLRDLTIQPGQAALRFIQRNRVSYYGPVGYFFLMITLMYLVASLLGIDMVKFLKNASDIGLQPEPEAGSGQEQFMQATIKLVSDNLKLVSFIIVPIQAFFSRFLFFRKSKLNFIEHTVLPFYTLGHLYWISILSLLSYSILGKFIPYWIQMTVGISYLCYGYSDMFRYQSRIKSFFKGLGVYFMAQLLIGLLTTIITIIVLIANPEVFEMFKPPGNR
ncbi:MAG: DUF3667 domain-containing protein [Cyclobacteriaceae bacterium]|nr:DUF3667 domain-containing protein [Cyclobacteriaceae bacterium]